MTAKSGEMVTEDRQLWTISSDIMLSPGDRHRNRRDDRDTASQPDRTDRTEWRG